MNATLPWTATDRRSTERTPCYDLAVAELSTGEARCFVRNRSKIGLLLEFRETPRLDLVFIVRDFAAGMIVRVRVIWHENRQVGVAIADPNEVAE